jgi:hypothetical protein
VNTATTGLDAGSSAAQVTETDIDSHANPNSRNDRKHRLTINKSPRQQKQQRKDRLPIVMCAR